MLPAYCYLLQQGNPLYSNHQDLLYDRFLPPTRLGLRVSGYACACYALTGRSGLWLCFVLIPRAYALGYGAAVPERDSEFPAPAGRS